MSQGKVLGEHYIVGEIIGRGGFSTVYHCTDMAGRERCAVKVLSKARIREAAMEEAFEREAMALRSVKYSPYVTNAIEILESTRNYYVIMDLAGQGTLLSLIAKSNSGKGLSPYTVRKYFSQLLQGLSDIHSSGFVHRDIKPENLLLDKWHTLKISDFGFAAPCDSERVLTRECGTPMYVAPEILSGSYRGPPVDVWSAGVTLYMMLSGSPPFAEATEEQLYAKIREGKYRPPRRPGLAPVPPAALHLISCCLCVDPEKRWTVDKLLRHPYLLGKNEITFKVHKFGLFPDVQPLSPSGDFTSPGFQSPRTVAIGGFVPSPNNILDFEQLNHSCPNLHAYAVERLSHKQPDKYGKKPFNLSVYSYCDITGKVSTPFPRFTTTKSGEDLDMKRSDSSCSSYSGHSYTKSPLDCRGDARYTPPERKRTTPTRDRETDNRFHKSIIRRLSITHFWLFLHFLLVCCAVVTFGALRIVFNINLMNLKLPASVKAVLIRFLEAPVTHSSDGSTVNNQKNSNLNNDSNNKKTRNNHDRRKQGEQAYVAGCKVKNS